MLRFAIYKNQLPITLHTTITIANVMMAVTEKARCKEMTTAVGMVGKKIKVQSRICSRTLLKVHSNSGTNNYSSFWMTKCNKSSKGDYLEKGHRNTDEGY